MEEVRGCEFFLSITCLNCIFQSEAVGDCVYDLPWYKLREYSTRRSLQLIIARSKRPSFISAGKFHPVNLESYFKSLTTAYSYCTVLLEVM